MNIVICEDDTQYCNYIKSVLEEHITLNQFNSKIVLATNKADDVQNYIYNNSEITIYYLDIKLCNNESGLDIAAEIRKKDHMSPIIFITNYGEMLPLTYEYKLEALDYIVKSDIETVKVKICDSLDFIEHRQKKGYSKCLNIQNKKKNFSIPFDSICYIESVKSSHKLILYYEHGMITFYASLKDVEKMLDERFLRCHKSIIINKDKIMNVDKKNHIAELVHGYKCVYSVKCKELIK